MAYSSAVNVRGVGQRPSQIKFWRPGQMSLFAKITTFPPLGQVTIVPPSRKHFEFTVVIESSTSLPEQPWEVAIWYDHGTCYGTGADEWRALALHKVATNPTMLYDSRENKLHCHTFEGQLPTPFPAEARTYKGRKVSFTVRYRINENQPWTWVHANFGTSDGEVILQPPLDPNYLGGSPVELHEGWFTRKLPSEAPGARLYSIDSSTTIPFEVDSAHEEHKVLGKVLMSHRWMALVRIWSPWLAPRHGRERFHLSEPAILCSFLRTDGQHIVLLAVNGIDQVLTTFQSDENGNIVVAARNDTGKDRKFKILAASAYKFDVAMAAVMYEMRKLVQNSSAYQENFTNGHVPTDGDVTPQWLASWYDSLAYCTWNSLGQDLNKDKIIQALQHFQDNDIHIANVIIDDNWQSLTGTQGVDNQFSRSMTAFEATPHAFPEGLKRGIDEIRQKFPHIRDIAVWHALMGYWGGISNTHGHIKDDYKLQEIELASGTPAAGIKFTIHADDIHRFYSDFYTFLSQSGITGVKTDVQFYLDLLTRTENRRDMINTYQSAWTQAHLRHLAGRAISCMSQIPQILYHSFLPTNTPRIMLRNSDDFFPDVPSSHPWHVYANAHTALFVQHLNVLPDWDMFQTSHAYSGFHAAARCISGGPIYITDYPGQSDVDLIKQMTAKNPRGDTVILRPSNVGRTLGIYDSYESGAVLKVGVYDGKAETGTGLLGVFNVADSEVNFLYPIDRIPGVSLNDPATNKKRWIVRSHASKRITCPIAPTLPIGGAMLLQANLPIRGYDIWSALPVHGPYQVREKSFDVAIVGLLGKMTGACALMASSMVVDAVDGKVHRLKLGIQLKALGVLGIWFQVRGSDKDITVGDDMLVLIHDKVVPQHIVQFSTADLDHEEGTEVALAEIDIETAFNEMKLEPGWSNEVSVDVYIS